MNRQSVLRLVAAVAASLAIAMGSHVRALGQEFPYKDAKLPVDARVKDLMGRMTLDEKVGQMVQGDSTWLKIPEVSKYFLGSVLSGGDSEVPDLSPKGWYAYAEQVQKQALTTRLGIPVLYGIDAVHGHNNVRGATVFPHNIGLGATRNAKLVEEIGRITALEVAATGIHWAFGPCVAVPQDERWARTYEGFPHRGHGKSHGPAAPVAVPFPPPTTLFVGLAQAGCYIHRDFGRGLLPGGAASTTRSA